MFKTVLTIGTLALLSSPGLAASSKDKRCNLLVKSFTKKGATSYKDLSDSEKKKFDKCIEHYDDNLPSNYRTFIERSNKKAKSHNAKIERDAKKKRERKELLAKRDEVTFSKEEIRDYLGFPVFAYRIMNVPSQHLSKKEKATLTAMKEKGIEIEKSDNKYEQMQMDMRRGYLATRIPGVNQRLVKLTDLDDLCAVLGSFDDVRDDKDISGKSRLYGKNGVMEFGNQIKENRDLVGNGLTIEEGFWEAIGLADEIDMFDEDDVMDEFEKGESHKRSNVRLFEFEEVTCQYNPDKRDKFEENEPGIQMYHEETLIIGDSENDKLMILGKIEKSKESNRQDKIAELRARRKTTPVKKRETLDASSVDKEIADKMRRYNLLR